MADSSTALLDKPTYSTDGTTMTQSFNTKDSRSVTFQLLIDTLSGSAGQTLDVSIEQSDQSDFADAYRITTLHSFTQVLGNSTSSSLIQQTYNNAQNTLNRYVRAKVVIAGTGAAAFTQKVTLLMLKDTKS
jgi:hypothetical protein